MVPSGRFGKPVAIATAVALLILCVLATWEISAKTTTLRLTAEANIALAKDANSTISERDLLAQQEMASWAAAAFWATAASVVVSAVALAGLFSSLAQTRKAIGDNRQLGEAQIQAYVQATKMEIGSSGTPVVHCLNSGSTPATHFAVSAVAQRVKLGSVESSIVFDPNRFKVWSALGAGSELSVALDVKDTQLIQDFVAGRYARDEVLLISGQIVYCTVFNHDHETQFAFFAHPSTPKRFRRPTSNLKSYHRISTNSSRAIRRVPAEVTV